MTVYGLILEEDNVSNLWNQSLFFPGDGESPSGVFLLPERVDEVKDNVPPQDLVNWYVWVYFVPIAISEPE